MNAQNAAAVAGADSDALFRMVIETAVDGIIVIDAEGRITFFSKAAERLFGYAAEDVMGKNITMLMPESYRSGHDNRLERHVDGAEPWIVGSGRDVEALRKDGTTFPMYLSVGEGWLHGERVFLGIIHDSTHRKRQQQQLHEMQNELLHAMRLTTMGQLTSALAHELNQPLTAVMNYLNATRRRLSAIEDPAARRARELQDKAVAQTMRAGQIVRRLRDFIEKKAPKRALEDLNASVKEAISLGLVGAADNNILVETEFAPDLPPLVFDRIQIQQVIVNLLRNAIEALEALEDSERREIMITTAMSEPDFVEIGVADTGPGVSRDMANHLFRPFTTSKPDGLGMGLTICRSIIDAHHGRLWASANPGGGAVFRFRLPIRDGGEA